MHFQRESIFVSGVRCFCNALAVVFGAVIAVVVAMMVIGMLSGPNMTPEKSEMQIAADADGNRTLLSHTAPVILKLDIHGIIGEGDLTYEKIQNLLLDSREDLLSNNRVKAILLHVNTPGGVATDADNIYRAIEAYKKKYNVPVYAFVDGLCASGGMYIGAAADKIYATSTSTIGSIGVILGPAFNFSGAMEKIGIQSMTISQGKDKDMLNPFRPWKPGEDQSLCAITKDLYDQFVNIVVAARPNLDKTKLIEEYGAQVYLAAQAQQLGYIDVAGSSYALALKDLVAAAQLPEGHPYQVVTLQTPHSFLADLAQGRSPITTGKVTHHLHMGSAYSSELSGKMLYLYLPQ